MTENSYEKSVRIFESLIRAPTKGRYPTPAALFHVASLPATSGYRNVAVLESEGMLRRADAGVYCLGDASIRTGLSANGFGDLAPKVSPILLQLRQATGQTCFIAIRQGMNLQIGPYLKGRLAREQAVSASYLLESDPDSDSGEAIEVGLLSQGDQISRRTKALLALAQKRDNQSAYAGILLRSARADAEQFSDYVARAAEQLSGGSDADA